MNYTTDKQFQKSFTQGQLGERVVACYLHIILGLKEIKFNTSNDLKTLRGWDIRGKINNQIRSYEVKTDLYEYHKGVLTGNMFIEVSCDKKPSGIKASTADYLVYYYPHLEVAYIMSKNILIDYLENNWKTHMSYGGDSGVSFGYLISREEIQKSNLFFTIDIPKEIYGL